jgi:mannose-6-phosphate isomerase-like protein (cupin superfamily)
MRSGDYHPNIQYDIILSGRVRLTLRKGEEDVSSEIGPGELIEIPPNTPHLFEFLEDTVMLEWWDGEFSAEYYGPYRDLIDAQAKENA